MADVHDADTRSRNMAAIRGRNTRPELLIRKFLHAAGFRYRLHAKDLAGKPDMVFPRYHAVVFVHGCFWHRHDCHLFKWPEARNDFWRVKIAGNVARDEAAIQKLEQAGWRIATIWECALKGRTKLDFPEAMQRLADWLRSDDREIEIRGG